MGSICITCRGKGMIGGCVGCGKTIELSLQPEAHTLSEVEKEDLAIPEYYRELVWSKDTFLKSHADTKSASVLERYAEQLTRIHSIFSSGKIPNKSFFVIAPKCMGKQTWAYSCMQQAAAHGYSVVPIIDNTQYKRLNIISSDRISSKFLKDMKYSIEDYNNADVLFLTVDPDNFQSSFRTIESLLSKRSRIGKPTFIISRFTLEQMSLLDYTGTFSEKIQVNPLQDKNKYAVIIGG